MDHFEHQDGCFYHGSIAFGVENFVGNLSKFESTAEIESEWTSENPIQISQKYGRKGCYCYFMEFYCRRNRLFFYFTGCFLDFLAFIGGASNPMKAAFSQHQ